MSTENALGPWYAKPTSGDQALIIDERTGANIAVVYNKRHAPAIAAQPDVLEALIAFSEAVWSDCRLPGDMRKELEALYFNGVRSAIAKTRETL